MEKTLRLDKLLSDSGQWSRKEAKQLLRQGRVQVDGQVERSADRKVCPAAVNYLTSSRELKPTVFRRP